MKTVEITLYQFEELSKEAKSKAIEKHRTNQQQHGDYLHLFAEDCKEQAKEEGFQDIEVQYSLSCSQGDGLSFSATEYTKLEELFFKHLGEGKEKTAKLLAENCSQKIDSNNGHYCYASKGDIDLYLENYTSGIICVNTDRIDEVVTKVLNGLEDIYIELCAKFEKQGYDEIEYQDSDEAIIKTIEANEYDFTVDGTIY